MIRVRYFTKAYLHANPYQNLIIYKPPYKFFEHFQEFIYHLWLAIRQLYGEVEAGSYLHHKYIPCITRNIFQLLQSMYDSSLLVDRSKFAALDLCTDDILSAMTKSIAKEEEKTPETFTCRNLQETPTELKERDLLNDGTMLKAYQIAYTTNLDIPDVAETSTKDELQRKLTPNETTKLKSIAGKLAWVATCTFSLYEIHARTSLKRNREHPGTPLTTIITTHDALQTASHITMQS